MTMDILITGRLKEYSLPKVFTGIQKARKTGVLTLRKDSLQKKIYFKKGDAIFASSNYEDDRLGEMLLKAGKITVDQYDHAVGVMKNTGKRLGGILVELGFLSPKNLFWGVKFQVREIIYGLFIWEDGEYSFVEGNLPTEEVITLRMSIANLIYEGVKRIENWTRIKKEAPPLDTVLQLSHDPLNLFQDIELAEEDRKILSLIDGKRTIKEIFNSSGMDNFKTLKAIYVLSTIGMAAVRAEEKEGEEPAVEILEEVLSAKPEGRKEELLIEKIHKFFNSLDDMNHYQVLGVDPGVSPSDIKKTYYRLSKEYHPDRHFESQEEGSQDELTAIFDRINKAYEILGDDGRRAEYDLSLSRARLSSVAGKEEGDFKSAEEQFRKGVEKLKKNNYKEASESFNQAAKLNPRKALYWSHLALSLSQIPKKLHDAEEACKKAIELEPRNDENYSNLGLFYLKAGLKKKAEAQFNEALKRNPKSQKALKGLKELQSKK